MKPIHFDVEEDGFYGAYWACKDTHTAAARIRLKPCPLSDTILYYRTSVLFTLSCSFVAAPFQLGLVWLSVLSTLPPNPSACLRVGVWDKPWDKFANYFETASSQFHFLSRGQKRQGFEAHNRPKRMPKGPIFLFGACLAK